MGLTSTMLLGVHGHEKVGFIAGVTILLGLPIGRLRRPAPSLRALLNATAIGVLLFLVWDVFSQAWAPIDDALASVRAGKGGLGAAAGYGALFAGGLAVGLLSLVYYESWIVKRISQAQTSGGFGQLRPGGDGRPRAAGSTPKPDRLWSDARRLSLLIAVGIGLHNFAEGLAIGQSAVSGELALALLLVIGFGLHNATEGFGIVAPLAGDVDPEGNMRRPRRFLLTMGQSVAAQPSWDRRRARFHQRGRQRRLPHHGLRIHPVCGDPLGQRRGQDPPPRP